MLQYIILNVSGFQKKKNYKTCKEAGKCEPHSGKRSRYKQLLRGQMLNLDLADRDFKAAIIINMFQELKNVIF